MPGGLGAPFRFGFSLGRRAQALAAALGGKGALASLSCERLLPQLLVVRERARVPFRAVLVVTEVEADLARCPLSSALLPRLTCELMTGELPFCKGLVLTVNSNLAFLAAFTEHQAFVLDAVVHRLGVRDITSPDFQAAL